MAIRRDRSALALTTLVVGWLLACTNLKAQPLPEPVAPDGFDPGAFATDLPPPPAQSGPTQLAPTQPGPSGDAPQPDLGPEPEPFNPRQTPAQPAVNQPQTPQLQGGFTVRLARAPKMLGDFFGNRSTVATGTRAIGTAVFQAERLGIPITVSVDPDPQGLNNFRIVEAVNISGIGPAFAYVGGSFGDIPGTVFGPGPAAAQTALPNPVTGLRGNGVPGEFIAENTGQIAPEVFDLEDPMQLILDLEDAQLFGISEIFAIEIPAGGPGDIIGRVRLQDNNSAMPQDRVYFDYSYFHNAALTTGGVDLNRFSPGLEKTFLDGMASVEVRMPFGVTINSNLVSGVAPDLSNFEVGNVVIAPKLLLSSGPDYAFSCGLGVALPTADDLRIDFVDGTNALLVENDSIHLLPYVAFLYSPRCSSSFAHMFVTWDFDTNGNDTFANVNGAGLERIGTLNDQNLITVNAAYGQWLYQARSRRERLQGVAWSAELHYTGSINDADTVAGGNFIVGNPTANLSLLNATIGGHVRYGQTTFTTSYAVPVTSDDRVFDGELRVIANRAF